VERAAGGARGEGAALALALPTDATVAPLKLIGEGRFESGFSDTLWFGEDHYTSKADERLKIQGFWPQSLA
jgi:hypothetical protein